MAQADLVQRVRIYLSTDDQHEGRPLYLAVLDELRLGGATGATALQGLAGFGPGQRVRIGPERAARQPVVIEWVDRAERVRTLLPVIDPMLGSALITVEDVPVYRAVLRARGPFADRGVGDIMRAPAPSVAADAPLSAALATMAHHGLAGLPVADGAGRLVGLIGERELAWRAGLRLGLDLLDALTPAERDPLLAPLIGRGVAEVMNAEPRAVLASTAIPQALVTMIEWGYSQVPVVDREGALLGLLSPAEVLAAAVAQAAAAAESQLRDADPPAPVGLVMQTATPQIAQGQPLALALAQILAAPARRLLVTDREGRLQGALAAADALGGLEGAERAAFLAALQRPDPTPIAALPGADRGFDELVRPAPPALAPEMAALDAARRLLELGADALPVVDSDRRLLGIIARGGLVRALMQQSE